MESRAEEIGEIRSNAKEKLENEKLSSKAAGDSLKPEISRLEAEIDGLLSDEAAAEATEQNYHMLLTAELSYPQLPSVPRRRREILIDRLLRAELRYPQIP